MKHIDVVQPRLEGWAQTPPTARMCRVRVPRSARRGVPANAQQNVRAPRATGGSGRKVAVGSGPAVRSWGEVFARGRRRRKLENSATESVGRL